MKRLCIIVAVVAAGVCALFWITRKSNVVAIRESAVPEVILSSLTRTDARLCRTNETQPFTGFAIEKHRDGTLKSRSMIVNGLLHGLSEGWFTNGQTQVTENFTNGVSWPIR